MRRVSSFLIVPTLERGNDNVLLSRIEPLGAILLYLPEGSSGGVSIFSSTSGASGSCRFEVCLTAFLLRFIFTSPMASHVSGESIPLMLDTRSCSSTEIPEVLFKCSLVGWALPTFLIFPQNLDSPSKPCPRPLQEARSRPPQARRTILSGELR